MKKVLWIACLLLVMPFLGVAQGHAGLAQQDIEAIFGPGPVSKKLPSHIQLNNIEKNRDGNDVWAHAMFIPQGSDHYGYYYEVFEDGSINYRGFYHNYYFTAAEYYKPYDADGNVDDVDAMFPVWAFADDLTKGFHRLGYVDGEDMGSGSPVLKSMNELTYDYYHEGTSGQGRMLGTKFGIIYEVKLNNPGIGSVTELYNYADHPNIGMPLTLACDLNGDLYFISASLDGQTPSKLYKFPAGAANNGALGTPVEVGEVGWAAQHLQTMAFEHKTHKLYWWQCDKDNNTNIVEIDPTTGNTTLVAETGNTEMGGLIFEFDYKDYIAYAQLSDDGDIMLYDGTGYTLTQNGYKPAKVVDFKVTDADCRTIDYVEVKEHGKDVVIYTIDDTELVNGVGHFTMPACDVDIVGHWTPDMYDVTMTWTPAAVENGLSSPLDTDHDNVFSASCDGTVTVFYTTEVPYYYVEDIYATYIDENGDEVTIVPEVNKANHSVSFPMVGAPVTVTALYRATVLTQVPNFCQYGHLPLVPCAGHSLGLEHRHSFTFRDPNGVETVYGGPTTTNSQINTILGNLTFDIPGVWYYTTTYINWKYGDFSTGWKHFTVYSAPRSVAIQEEYEIDVDLVYNAHYNCDGDSILLTVVADPADYVFDGTFEWEKDGVKLATTTDPVYLIKPCNTADAGNYSVHYRPNVPDNARNCDFDINDFAVNVATIPNDPIIETKDGRNPICYGESTTLIWRSGVLNPLEYDVKWYKVDATGAETLLEGETDVEYVTPALTEDATYYVQINYGQEGGDYYLCHSESDLFTVHVNEQLITEVEGDMAACQGVLPDNVPTLMGTYNNIEWYIDGYLIEESNTNELPFDHVPASYYLNDSVGSYKIYVKTESEEECDGYYEFFFDIIALPELTITNNIDPEVVASSNDAELAVIYCCEGDRVNLVADGADTYVWGEGVHSFTGQTHSFVATTTTTFTVHGTNEQTTCENSASIKVVVRPRPTITWIEPAEGTEPAQYSMIAGPVTLQATPEGGTFTYIIKGEPLSNAKPIADGILNPSEIGVGDYQLIYSYTDPNGCTNEIRVRDITIYKPYWTDTKYWDPNWYANCTGFGGYRRFQIETPAQLGSFLAYVYGLNGVTQTDFANDTIWIENDLNMREEPVFCRPFCDTAQFKGVIDGLGHQIENITILENDLQFYVDGFVRNVGVKHPIIESVGNPCSLDVHNDARFHNSYVTMPELTNVLPKLNPSAHLLPSGEVRNVYYYGNVPGIPMPIAIYMETNDHILTPNVPSADLLHVNDGEVADPTIDYTGILERWVWLQNDFYYWTWKTEPPMPTSWQNYGYPVFEHKFVHHHYITLDNCDDPLVLELGGVMHRTIDGVDYTYAMNNDEITLTVAENEDYPYSKVDKLVCDVIGYHGTTDYTFEVTPNAAGVFTFNMPKDSLYYSAYSLNITPECSRKYWHLDNWNENWYTNCLIGDGGFKIESNRDLAAFAHAVLVDGIDFEGVTVRIVGDNTTLESEILDMTGYYWMPVTGFKGDFDGTHYIVDNLFIREDVNAMFVDCDCLIRNLGIQDANMIAGENTASFMINSGNHQAEVVNGFATHDPSLAMFRPLASGNVTVTNCYTLDEGGNMKNENGVGTDLLALSNWVHVTASDLYWDWIPDTGINYGFPIHDNQYVPGIPITYVPSEGNHGDTPGWVDGPDEAVPGETVVVWPNPVECANCTALWYEDENGNPVDILATATFTMPNYPVTVYGEFVKWDWNLTINYVVDADPSIHIAPHTEVLHLGDPIHVVSPTVAGYEPVEGMNVVDDVMPCHDYTITVHYIGQEHNITFCEAMAEFATEWSTSPADAARFHDIVTINITAKEGQSITNVSVIPQGPTATTAPTVTTVSNGVYTFEMPSSDVMICIATEEKFWDGWSIGDISWFINNEDATEYTLTTDSMLGGLAALVSGREWLFQDNPEEPWLYGDDREQYTAEEVAQFNFAGKTIYVEDKYGNGVIDLIEHKWRPIGAQFEFMKKFQGYFDGQNVEIINMRTGDYTNFNEPGNGACQAFFGNVGDQAVITNLHIQGVVVKGRYFSAGIAGVNEGHIINSVANVKVNSEFEAGGIVGNNFGWIYNSYCIADTINCTAAMPVTAKATNNYYVGGVAAYNGGIITNCHSVAYLHRGGTEGNNPQNWYGGVVGMNDGEVSYCYWLESELEGGVGGGAGTFENCDVIKPATVSLLNNEISNLDAAYEYNVWKQGDDNYPVFDLERVIMSNNEHNINVDLYPNPTKGMVNIFSENIQRVTVFNMFGQMVLDTEVNGNETSINMSSFSAGVYMVRIATAEGVVSRNVIVE